MYHCQQRASHTELQCCTGKSAAEPSTYQRVVFHARKLCSPVSYLMRLSTNMHGIRYTAYKQSIDACGFTLLLQRIINTQGLMTQNTNSG